MPTALRSTFVFLTSNSYLGRRIRSQGQPEPFHTEAKYSLSKRALKVSLLISQMPQFLDHIPGLLLDLLQDVHFSFELGIPELDPTVQVSFTSTEKRGRISSLNLLAALLLRQPRTLVC